MIYILVILKTKIYFVQFYFNYNCYKFSPNKKNRYFIKKIKFKLFCSATIEYKCDTLSYMILYNIQKKTPNFDKLYFYIFKIVYVHSNNILVVNFIKVNYISSHFVSKKSILLKLLPHVVIDTEIYRFFKYLFKHLSFYR